MAKDITALLKMNDLVRVTLKRPMTPRCVGSETCLSPPSESTSEPLATSVTGTYVGSRPGLIKINPIDGRILADDGAGISRYVVVDYKEIKEVQRYGKPEKIFP